MVPEATGTGEQNRPEVSTSYQHQVNDYAVAGLTALVAWKIGQLQKGRHTESLANGGIRHCVENCVNGLLLLTTTMQSMAQTLKSYFDIEGHPTINDCVEARAEERCTARY